MPPANATNAALAFLERIAATVSSAARRYLPPLKIMLAIGVTAIKRALPAPLGLPLHKETKA
jgi:hypothetical protein